MHGDQVCGWSQGALATLVAVAALLLENGCYEKILLSFLQRALLLSSITFHLVSKKSLPSILLSSVSLFLFFFFYSAWEFSQHGSQSCLLTVANLLLC